MNSNLEYRNKLGNAFNTAHIRRDFRANCFLCSSKKIVGLLSFTFTMSNYSYRLLSRCDKQLGSHLVLLHETILGLTRIRDRALATNYKKSPVVRLVATVLHTSSIKNN